MLHSDLTADRVRELLDYDPKTGIFRWRRNAGRHGRYPAGSVAGYLHTHSRYWIICIGQDEYRAHRVAWLYVHSEWPKGLLDHRDLDRSNNRIGNLREATRSQNSANRSRQRNNTSGFKGVRFDKSNDRWVAVVAKKKIGYFRTFEEAKAACIARAGKQFGEFARLE